MERVVLQIRPASGEDAETIFQLVQETIETVYPHYYPREVVDFSSISTAGRTYRLISKRGK